MANENHRFSTLYADLPRHWCPQSQRFAGGDALLTYLNDGWEIQDNIYYEEYWHGGARRVLIFYFVLARKNECVTMRVLGNPMVDRLLNQLRLRVIPTAGVRARIRQPQQPRRQLN
ncbi:MAG: hypothetical protein K8J31_07430 [Anaerolineae bacterium]|nr:hypothetical protein [Anaerolineae bacterium]